MDTNEAPGLETDRAIGAAMARHRLARGWTQQDLADQMRDRHWPWTQQMVAKMEKGARPVRFAEARDMAQVFRVSPQELLSNPLESAVEEVRRQRRLARKQLEDTKHRIQVLEALLAASTGAEMQIPSPVTSVLFAFRVPNFDWSETVAILTHLGASERDLSPIRSLMEAALAQGGAARPVGEALWELLQRLLPSLSSTDG